MDKKCLVKCPTKFLFASWYVLMLKLQHFGHLMQRADSLEKTLMLGETEGRDVRARQDIATGIRLIALTPIRQKMHLGE